MPRVPVLHRAPLLTLVGFVLLLVAAFGGTGASPFDLRLTADGPGGPGGAEISVHDFPAQLDLHENGLVTVKAAPPAAPGDTIYLNSAGAYGAGYYHVSQAVLGSDLGATLRVDPRDYLGSFEYWATLPATAAHLESSSGHFKIEIVSPQPQVSPGCGDAAPLKADGTPWTCTYDDEFNGPELDRRYWVPQRTEISGFTTGTKLTYACAQDSPDTVDVENGNLELSLVDLGEKRDCGHNTTSRYSYGQVMHHQTYSQTYGRYEVRALIPDLREPGSAESFWLWPETDSYGPWPASGEIDNVEFYSNTPGLARPFIHYLPGQTEKDSTKNITHAACPIRVGRYNTYDTIWEPGRITILVNGTVCMVDDYSSATSVGESTAPFDKPFYFNMAQAMGSIGNDYDPAVMPDKITTKIDYVRIWK
ncbi:MAG: family 16 glycosylhydrolase [Marmoricola sp.]